MSKIQKAMERADSERAGSLRRRGRLHEFDNASMTALVPVFNQANVYEAQQVPAQTKLLEKNRILKFLDVPAVKDQYSLLRTRLFQKTGRAGANVVMVAGVTVNDGATLNSINLAMSIADDLNHSAVLIDAQLRRAKMQKYLGVPHQSGLSQYLMHGAPLQELLSFSELEDLSILVAGESQTNSTELLGSSRMKTLVAELKSFSPRRYIVLNAPPLLQSPDAIVLSAFADAILLVVREGKTTQAQVRKACELLEGTPVLGVVLNNSRLEKYPAWMQ